MEGEVTQAMEQMGADAEVAVVAASVEIEGTVAAVRVMMAGTKWMSMKVSIADRSAPSLREAACIRSSLSSIAAR